MNIDKVFSTKQGEVANMQHSKPIYRFFWLISRFEYALKIVGFCNKNGDAKPNWDAFAKSIIDKFDKDANKELAKGVDYIQKYPPKKQIVINGELHWSKALPKNKPELELLLILIRRVRNNLFHGGKYKGRHLDEPDRSEQLIMACISILEHCLTLSPEVKEAFGFNLE